MSAFIKIRVWNQLLALVAAGGFFAVNYDPTTRAASVDTSKSIVPSSVIGNRTASTYRAPLVNRREPLLRERESMTFELTLVFDREVVTEAFEFAMNQGVAIPEGDGCPLLFVDMLSDANVEPPRQDSNSGTKITYTLLVRPKTA